MKAGEQPWRGPGLREFVVMMAALMASNALATDVMLPALPAIVTSLHVGHDNDRQLIIIFFLIGFGLAQFVYGPLSDRFGRKPILVWALVGYFAFALLSAFASSFALLLAARTLNGAAAASSRVLVVSIIRDRYQGETMARIMSFAGIFFMLVPVLAPSIGQAVLAVASWRYIFILLALYALVVGVWAALRLPETLPPARRRPLSLDKVREAVAATLTHRLSIGNTVAGTLIFGALIGYLSSIQQIVFDVFHRPDSMPIIFAFTAAAIALGSYLNSRLVEAYGSRRIMLVALGIFVGATSAHLAVTLLLGENLFAFVILQALSMACFGFIFSNLASIAMAPLGHIAGTASSVQGAITTLGGALIGRVIGQYFNGTTIPLSTGFVLCGISALLLAIWVNRGENVRTAPTR